MPTPPRETWASRFGFIMATAGFAVGLGNIWRFPYMVGQNGGGAFLLLYVIFAVFIGVPLLTAEISLGRRAQSTPIAGMTNVTGSKTNPWNLFGWLGVGAAVLIQSYYVMLIGWIVGYLGRFLRGEMAEVTDAQQAFGTFISDPRAVLGYTLLVVVLLGAVVSRGLRVGLERAAKLAMPLLVVLLVLLAVRSLTLPDAMDGLVWYLRPDFGAIDGSTVMAALGQAFYSIGIGMAAAFGLGSYLHPKDSDVPGNAAIVVAFDTAIAFLAGLVIFPAVLAFGLEPDAGAGLIFVTLTEVFQSMPAGQVVGSAFFFLLLLAALTSAVALHEVLTATVTDLLPWTRAFASWTVATCILVLSMPMILSQGPWSDLKWFGKDLFSLADFVSGNVLLPVGGLLLALYVVFAWTFRGFLRDANVGAGRVRVTGAWRPLMLGAIPLAVVLVLLAGLGVLG